MLRYAGIGSRETPQDIQHLMANIGHQLAKSGWLLRSGHADGADKAFFEGATAASGGMEIFIPWYGFNDAPRGDPRFILPNFDNRLMGLASSFHPYWDKCSPGAKKLHARNVCQVLGQELDQKAHMVVCWTKDGKRGGGTGQALRIAEAWKIPIFDLAIPQRINALVDFVNQIEKTQT